MRVSYTASKLFAVISMMLMPSLVAAQTGSGPYAYSTRYDDLGRVVGTIAPDPDSTGPLPRPATRTTFDTRNLQVLVENGALSQWKDASIAPENWGVAFNVHTSVETQYDANRRKIAEIARGSDGVVVGYTQFSYDNRGRLECTAVRMNSSLPAYQSGTISTNACDLGPEGSGANDFGPDRITKNFYDNAGQVEQVRRALWTSDEIAEATYTYTDNGQIEYLIDANGNKAELQYDDFDRQTHWYFPDDASQHVFDKTNVASALASAGAPSATDFEQYAYDENGNRITLRKRDGSIITYTYDALNRVVVKDLQDRPDLEPDHERDVYYSYDLRGLQTSARFNSTSGLGIITTYDGFGAVASEQSTIIGVNAVQSRYDLNGNRTQVIYPDGHTFSYEYDGLNRHTKLNDPYANILVDVGYGSRGLPTAVKRNYNAPWHYWTYDAANRLETSTIDTTAPQYDVTWTFDRNPASQIASEYETNDEYSWDGLVGVPITAGVQINRQYEANGLNQYTEVGGSTFAYDDNGNLTSDGTDTFTYDHENRMVRADVYDPASQQTYVHNFYYDPMGRLYGIHSTNPSFSVQRFVYDGDALIAEYDYANTMQRRHVHGAAAGVDDPLVTYNSSNVYITYANFLSTDARGSIAYSANRYNTGRIVNTYDEYGNPGQANGGRFQYTGQVWLPELEMYYYKARIYSPKLGRFMQTDPIGYEDQFNLYAYVGNDPINGVDPTGMREVVTQQQLLEAEAKAMAELEQAQKRAESNRGTSSIPMTARGAVVTLTLATACDSPPCGEFIYATYTKTNPETRQVYSGRTSIFVKSGVDPEIAGAAAVARRDTHHSRLNGLGFGPAVLDRASSDEAAIRGREQNLIDHYGGAQSVGGTSANRRNGISDFNPKRGYYFYQMRFQFGPGKPSNRQHACGFLTGRCD